MDALLDMLRNIGNPVDPLTIDTLEQNMRAGGSPEVTSQVHSLVCQMHVGTPVCHVSNNNNPMPQSTLATTLCS